MPNIHILHGPNLNLLGKRTPTIYGGQSMPAYLKSLRSQYPEANISYFQSNHEGTLIDYLQKPELTQSQGLIINPGALAHSSYALADAAAALNIPVIELHISNIYAREPWRRRSLLAAYVQGLIVGLGIEGHELALRYLLARL